MHICFCGIKEALCHMHIFFCEGEEALRHIHICSKYYQIIGRSSLEIMEIIEMSEILNEGTRSRAVSLLNPTKS